MAFVELFFFSRPLLYVVPRVRKASVVSTEWMIQVVLVSEVSVTSSLLCRRDDLARMLTRPPFSPEFSLHAPCDPERPVHVEESFFGFSQFVRAVPSYLVVQFPFFFTL